MKAWQYIERGWTQRNYAVDRNGCEISSLDSEAVRWCLLGALQAAYRVCSDYHIASMRVRAVLEKQCGPSVSLVMWNDHPERVQEDVVAVLKEADV